MNDPVYKVLIIDDDPDVYDTIKHIANKKNIDLKWFGFKEDGVPFLEENDIDGVILDAKGKISIDDTEEDIGFFHQVLENETIKKYPRVFYTGIKDIVEKKLHQYNSSVPVFGKDETDKMFDALRALIEKRAEYKIEIDYAEYFIIFDDYYLDRSLKKHLIRIINNVKNGVDVLNEIRTFIDKIYLKLKDHGICDQRLYRNTNDPISGWFPLYLSNKNVKKDNQIYIPKTGKNWLKNEVISNSLWLLKNLCNNSSHNFYKDNNSFTANTYNIMHLSINSIFLLVDWVKAVVDNKEKADNEIDNWLLKSTKA